MRAAVKKFGVLYGLLLPGLLLLGLFVLYPNAAIFRMSLYSWIPGHTEVFIGYQNYLDLFADPLFWRSFELVILLLIANLFKIWPAIFAAIVLHRLQSQRWQSIYRALFIIPFVVPTLVWVLLWKSFYDPGFGVLNQLLLHSGLMDVVHFLDGTPESPGWMPRIAAFTRVGLGYSVIPLFGSVWALLLGGLALWRLCGDISAREQRSLLYLLLLVLSTLPLLSQQITALELPLLYFLLAVAALVLFIALGHALPGAWLGWFLFVCAGWVLFRDQPFRLPVLLVLIVAVYESVMAQFHHYRARVVLRKLAVVSMICGAVLILLAYGWNEPTGEFALGQPAWLGSEQLVVPAVMFWGFPWVGTIGVLIYLAGLQRIPHSVYEAARMEGVGSWGMIFKVELPLILTQVRINLVFMTLTTLTQYEFFLLLLGTDGGPGNRGMVPGLLMFREAFELNRFGYASAIGVLLFFVILGLTLLYTRYLQTDR